MFTMEESSGAYTNSGYTENRGSGQPGYMWSNIRNVLDEEDGFCGIYEFQVRGTLLGQLQSAVVYVVSTCPRGADGGVCRRFNSSTTADTETIKHFK